VSATGYTSFSPSKSGLFLAVLDLFVHKSQLILTISVFVAEIGPLDACFLQRLSRFIAKDRLIRASYDATFHSFTSM
jgi:hypothetical protein